MSHARGTTFINDSITIQSRCHVLLQAGLPLLETIQLGVDVVWLQRNISNPSARMTTNGFNQGAGPELQTERARPNVPTWVPPWLWLARVLAASTSMWWGWQQPRSLTGYLLVPGTAVVYAVIRLRFAARVRSGCWRRPI